jgi:hypothetical protein
MSTSSIETQSPGRVIIVNVSDENYWSFFVDGEFFGSTYKEYFTETLFRRSTQKELAKKAGVAVDELRFDVYEDFFFKAYDHVENLGQDYDSNDYISNVSATMALIAALNLAPGLSNATLDEVEENY